MKLAWITDVHLNFLEYADRKKFYEDIVAIDLTHSSSYYKPLDNLTVKAGSVEYGKPIVQEIIEL